MVDALDTAPTILLVAEDLLTALLMDRLTAQGYRVTAPDPVWISQHPAGLLPIDLILAEVRYPYDACITTLGQWRSRTSQPDPPLVLIGHAPPGLAHRLHGRVTWLEGGAPLDIILTAVARWTSQQPNPARSIARARPLDVGQSQS
jgi:hypothetical protein